jgi:hypothetical protein
MPLKFVSRSQSSSIARFEIAKAIRCDFAFPQNCALGTLFIDIPQNEADYTGAVESLLSPKLTNFLTSANTSLF